MWVVRRRKQRTTSDLTTNYHLCFVLEQYLQQTGADLEERQFVT